MLSFLITHGLAALGGGVVGLLFGMHNPTIAAAVAKASTAAGQALQAQIKKV